MATLARDAANFKSALSRQDTTSWHSKQQAQAHAQSTAPPTRAADSSLPTAGSGAGSKKKQRPKANVVYSQPADTGIGHNVNTQLLYAVNHLKANGNPMRLQDLSILIDIPLDEDPILLEKFRAHERVVHDPRTDLYSYRNDFNFRSKEQLLTEIQRHTRKGGGLSIRTLKESWKEAPSAIEELEKEGKVLVTRTTKDGQLRMVFWNEIPPEGDAGGAAAEKEFQDLWHSLKVPNEVDLLKSLAQEGLQATASTGAASKGPMTKKKGRKSAPKQRATRITNTHLKMDIDLTRDYTGPSA